MKFYFVVAPAKWDIYNDKVKYVNKNNKFLFDLILENKGELNIIDVRKELIEARKIADTYTKLDTHWTEFGGYIAWQKIATEMKKENPEFKPFGINDLKGMKLINGDNEYNDWFGANIQNNWTMPELNNPFKDYYINFGTDDEFKITKGTNKVNANLTSYARTKNPDGNFNLLFLGDSQTASLSPFITSSFKEVFIVAYLNINFNDPSLFKKKITESRPDVIIYVITQRMLINFI